MGVSNIMNGPRVFPMQQMKGNSFEMDPDELGQECRELINIIAGEFESDPMSVQCFDLRVVKRVIEAAKIHRQYVTVQFV